MDKAKILNATGRNIKRLTIPQWGFDVCLRSWSVKERQEFTDAMGANPQADVFAKIAIRTLCDEQGKLLFTDEDLPALLDKDIDALLAIAQEAMSFNVDTKKNPRR